jgi:hypothetical protein
MIFAGMIQSQHQMDLDDEVQVIDPPVIIQPGHKKYHRKILKEEIDVHFCRRSKRINQNVDDSSEQDNIDTIDVIAQAEDSQDANLDLLQIQLSKMLLPDKFFFMYNFSKYLT